MKCIDDEIPFEVPEGWEWCRIPKIAKSITAGGDKPEQFSKYKTLEYKIPIYSNGIQKNGLYGYTNCATVFEPSVTISARGTIGFACPRYEPYYPIVRLISVTPIDNRISIDYLTLVLSYLLVSSTGSSIPQLTVPLMSKKLIPLPSTMEQTRIVETTQNLFNSIDFVDEKKETIYQLLQASKSKILDLAIRGKLVPQNPDDEPASVLLERIRAEKEELIKQGKIKRDKNESVIYKGDDNSYYEKFSNGTQICIDEEIPFDIPKSWQWTRLSTLAQYRKGPFGSSLTKAIFIPETTTAVKVYEQKNAICKDANLGNYYISQEKFESMRSFEVFPNDIIVSCAGTIGETFLMPNNMKKGIINQALMKISLYDLNLLQFYLIYFDFMLKGMANEQGYGNALKNIPPFDILKKYLIPTPPINEQKAIVSKICNLFSIVDSIEQSLS
ncbi:restriction endonuclease subunit S [Campylobacter hyointestinalis]|uniref:restriction endonuclease subunit S n=1 Tax=Campylobacter hyointestinalis TaxID=198 RepID=UPI0007272997|nr:restriction endonuclease subunit S [Campylobacter hyointestinalis]CUU81373.1 Type I restriction-modification system%2C specificity subunit S [Campylobacter hyointestinalis subsp. hyointestinalis]